MAAGFEHPKVKVHVGDGFAFLEDKVDSFDVIITDSSDPVGKCPTNSKLDNLLVEFFYVKER